MFHLEGGRPGTPTTKKNISFSPKIFRKLSLYTVPNIGLRLISLFLLFIIYIDRIEIIAFWLSSNCKKSVMPRCFS